MSAAVARQPTISGQKSALVQSFTFVASIIILKWNESGIDGDLCVFMSVDTSSLISIYHLTFHLEDK